MFGVEAAWAWSAVVSAVHAAGGKIFSQLWHTGAIRTPGVGRALIANPDLPEMIRRGSLEQLRPYDAQLLGELH